MPSINTQYAQTRYNLTSSPNRTIKHIVIHYTATSADAQSNCKYFGAANRNASADFFINKDGSIYQFNKDIKNYYSWHCGDGYGKYGITNAQSVGIENVSSGEDFTSQQISSLAGLVQMLMKQLNVPASNVVRHYDASRKLCPLPYIDNAKWKKLWQQITSGTGSPITGSDGANTGTDVGTATVNVMSIAYDREKDPLVLEFGYAAQVSSGGNMGTYLKAQQAKAKYPVSAINTADLLNDIFDIWHINATDGSAGTGQPDSGTQVAGRAVMKSGRVVTTGTKKEVPAGVAQTGLIASYTGYDQAWSAGTTQRTIYDLWNQASRPTAHGVCTLSGYYLIAPGRYFSNSCGDILEVVLENGYKFMCMVADAKGRDAPSDYGHYYGSAVDIIEWESVAGSVQAVNSALKAWGVYGVKVKYMINYGSWFS